MYWTLFQVLISALVVVAAVAKPVVKRTNGVISVHDDDVAPEIYSTINRGGRNYHRGFLRHPYHLFEAGDYHLIDSDDYHLTDANDYHLLDAGDHHLIGAGERQNLVKRSPVGPKKLGKKAFFGAKKTVKNNKPGNLPGKTKGNKKVFKGGKKTLKANGKGTKAFAKGCKKGCVKKGE